MVERQHPRTKTGVHEITPAPVNDGRDPDQWWCRAPQDTNHSDPPHPKSEHNNHVETMHWSHNKAGRWRCAVLGATYQAYRVGDRKWMAEKIDPAGHYTSLGSYETLKNCKVHAGLDYVSEMRQAAIRSR
jgi:hypothetical protein